MVLIYETMKQSGGDQELAPSRLRFYVSATLHCAVYQLSLQVQRGQSHFCLSAAQRKNSHVP